MGYLDEERLRKLWGKIINIADSKQNDLTREKISINKNLVAKPVPKFVAGLALRGDRFLSYYPTGKVKKILNILEDDFGDFYRSAVWTDGDNVYYSSGTTQYVLDKDTSIWHIKTWTGMTNFHASSIWTDGENIYYSSGSTHYVLDKATSTWSVKTWTGLTSFASNKHIWTDGENIYYSYGSNQYVLDKTTSTWNTKTWSGLTDFNGSEVWMDGENIYYSRSSTQYVLDKSTSTWNAKTWTGISPSYGSDIWIDGENIYYSSGSTQRVLDKTTSTWSKKTWTGLTNFYGTDVWADGDNIYLFKDGKRYKLNKEESAWEPESVKWLLEIAIDGRDIWTDGENIYYSHSTGASTSTFVLDLENSNKESKTWNKKTWTGLAPGPGRDIWTDGENIYYSNSSAQYVLDKSTSTWNEKTWTELSLSLHGEDIWTDGENIYCSSNSIQYVLDKSTSTWSKKTWTGLTNFNSSNVWSDGEDVYYSDSSYSKQYVLNKTTSTWSQKNLNTGLYGKLLWSVDGEEILDMTLSSKTLVLLKEVRYGNDSEFSGKYILSNKLAEKKWDYKATTGDTFIDTMSGIKKDQYLSSQIIWTDGENIYFNNYLIEINIKLKKASVYKHNITAVKSVTIDNVSAELTLIFELFDNENAIYRSDTRYRITRLIGGRSLIPVTAILNKNNVYTFYRLMKKETGANTLSFFNESTGTYDLSVDYSGWTVTDIID